VAKKRPEPKWTYRGLAIEPAADVFGDAENGHGEVRQFMALVRWTVIRGGARCCSCNVRGLRHTRFDLY
jgi:hypothetical protein